MRERSSRRDFLLAGVEAGASLAWRGRETFPRLRLRCKEQNANTEADMVRLAEQVLAELAGEIRTWVRLWGVECSNRRTVPLQPPLHFRYKNRYKISCP